MGSPINDTPYKDDAIDWIEQEKDTILSVSQILGVSATAIAGYMAKECSTRNVWDFGQDQWICSNATDMNILDDYVQVKSILGTYPDDQIGQLDQPELEDKLAHYTLNDVGFGNIKILTAIDALLNYSTIMFPTSDPLGLKNYTSHLGQFAIDLASNVSGLAVKIAGLIALDAENFFLNRGACGWDQMSQYEIDSRIITVMINGSKRSEINYQDNIIKNDGIYYPQAGGGTSGGIQYLNNSSFAPLHREMCA